MSASDNFNAAALKVPERYGLEILNDHVIRGTQRDNNGWTVHVVTMDFLNRLVTVLPGGDTKGGQIFTFADFDAGSIEWHYHQLKATGKNPRPPEGLLDKTPAAPAKGPGLSL